MGRQGIHGRCSCRGIIFCEFYRSPPGVVDLPEMPIQCEVIWRMQQVGKGGKRLPQCPECGRQFKSNFKLNTHCRKAHKIAYGLSRETYDRIIYPVSSARKSNDYIPCPECGRRFISVKTLGNHYALSHARDLEQSFSSGRRVKRRKRSGVDRRTLVKRPRKLSVKQKLIREKAVRQGFHDGAKVPHSNLRKIDK